MRLAYTFTLLFCLIVIKANTFPNCNIYDRDDSCYQACIEAEIGIDKYVGSIPFQYHLLKSIELCPEFSYSHFELSVPYAKMGLMHDWIKIMDKAVEANPTEHLGWRGWYHWFFMHNYEKAIADIEALDAMIDYDIGQTGDGQYHLNVLKGLCYKGLGDNDLAIKTIESAMESDEYVQGSYDKLHLGVLYLETDQCDQARELFEQQIEYNPLSEVYYYMAQCYYNAGETEKAQTNLEVALSKYDARMSMTDPYRQLPDEIYRSDIENLIAAYAN